jgi:outer membrane receptor protein involved in Fe transport
MPVNLVACPFRRLAVPLAWLFLSWLAAAGVAAGEVATRTFDVPAGDAADTLKRFAVQAQREIMFPAESVAGVKTHAVKGALTPRQALDRMVADTGLTVVEDPKTGAVMIIRALRPPSSAPPPKPPTEPPSGKSPKMSKHTNPFTLLGSWLAVALASAQAADTPPAEIAASDPAITLTPFEVRTDRDNGYYSPDTLSGGRTNTALKDTPAAVTVINRQFLDDIAAKDVYQAEIWSVNAFPTYNPGNATTGSQNRGPNFSFFSRNYFLWYVKSDGYNTERFEFGRGPNGVLFGDGNIGGLATTMTKQAKFEEKFVSISGRVDSYGGFRATADVNVPVTNKFALRLNLLTDRGTMWQDNSNQYRDGAHLAGTYKIFERTSLRFEGEVGNIDRQIYPVNYAENASYWDRTTVYTGTGTLNTNAGGPGVARVSTSAQYFVNIPGTPAAGYANWATFYRTTGSTLAMRDYVRGDLPTAVPMLPRRDLNLMPPDARYLLRYATSTAYLEHRVTDNLFAQVAFNTTRTPYKPRISESTLNQYYIDINTVMPNGAPNPNFGKPYAENTLNKTFQQNTVTEGRAFIAYRFDTKWWKGNINALVGDRFDKFDFDQRRLVQTNGAVANVTNVANEYHFREYWDQPVNFGELPNIPGATFDYARYTNVIHQRKFIDYGQIATVNKFFKDRLTLFLGGRRDHVYQTQRARIADDPVTGAPILGATIIPAGQKNAVSVAGAKATTDKNVTAKNGGGVLYVLPWLGVYHNFSQTFSTPDAGNNLIDGQAPGISFSGSHETGVKLNLWDGRIYADARYYKSKQTNALTTTGSAGQINAIWTQLGRTDLNTLAYRDTLSLALDGYEFELVANPTRNIRLMANYSKPQDQRNVDALPGLRAYYAEHSAEWKAAAATNPTIQTNLTSIESLLAANATLATINNFTKYRANFYGTYSFYTGGLKGLAFGAGANLVGPAKVGSGATAFDYLYAGSYYLVSGHLAYTMNVAKTQLRFQLNISNAFDQRKPIATSFFNYKAQGVATNPNNFVPNGFRFNDPRQVIFSTTVKF